MAKLSANEMNFITTLVNNGCSLEQALSLLNGETVKKPVSTKVETPKVITTSDNKPANKVSKPKATALKLKEGSFFKTVNPKTNKVGFVAKVKKIDYKDKIVFATNTKQYALEYCQPITAQEFAKLKKSLQTTSAKAEKKSTSSRLAPKDYKAVYALYLVKQGKIDQAKFDEIKNDDKALSELYSQFKNEVKLDNASALKLLASNTSVAMA